LPEYLNKIAEYLDKIVYSTDENNNSLTTARIEEAEEAYKLTLKLAIQKNDPLQESLCIEKLGDVYIGKGTRETLLQAAGLYNYAMLLAPQKRREILRNKLSRVQDLLIKTCNGKSLDSQTIKKKIDSNHLALKNFREKIEEKIQRLTGTPSFQEVKGLYNNIAQNIKAFFSSLVNQAIDVLGPAPCEYAMIGFGSLAREEMTPYSDLEFGILMQTENPENRDYFKHLTTLIHLKVINLGETILPALNIPCLKAIDFFDVITPRGFAFDGAGVEGKGCKTPFGNGKTFELIQTPEKMAQYIAKDEEGQWWHDKEPHLPMELLTFTHLIGNSALTEQYRQKIQKKLDIFCQAELSLREYLAKQHLVVADMEAFNPGMGDLSRQGMLFKVKNDFYRFPHLALDRLALLKKVMASDTFTRIDQLNKLGIMTAGAANKLKEWMSIALFMRLKTYSHYQAQQEMMNPLIKPFGFDQPELIKKQFALDQEALSKVKNIYRIFIPFYKALREFLEGREDSLRSSNLEDNSPQTQGNIALRLFQHEEAKEYYELAKKENPEDPYILGFLGIIYNAQGNVDKAAKYVKKALTISLGIFDENHPYMAAIYSNLGGIYFKQDTLFKAAKYIKKSLTINLKILGKNHSTAALHYNNLGQIFQAQGNLYKAAKYTKKALTTIRMLLNENHPYVAIIYSNLGQIYWQQDNVDKAIEYGQKALIISIKLFGENHPHVATFYTNLGGIYQKQGNLGRAHNYMQKALIIALKVLGENHPIVAAIYQNVGQTCKELGNLEQAAEYTKKALDINLKLCGKNHSTVATDYASLGQIYHEQKNLKLAIDYMEKAHRIASKLFDENHPALAKIYMNLGVIYKEQNKLEQATEYINKALTINHTLYGENHSTKATAYNNLAALYREQGNLDDAVKYTRNALTINRTLYGENHPSIAIDYINLGAICNEQGNLDKAAEYTYKALIIDIKLFGENHPTIASIYNNLGIIYLDQKDLEKATVYTRKALAILFGLFGEIHYEVANCYNSRGVIYQHQGYLTKAAKYVNKALIIDLYLFGENYPLIASRYINLGQINQDQGNIVIAAKYYQQALNIALKILGEKHPNVLSCCTKLEEIYQQQGKLEEAFYYASKALGLAYRVFGKDHLIVAQCCYRLLLLIKKIYLIKKQKNILTRI
jgi:tetratricopeptide (TPR) repeat protein/predicted nucleotidyltransferase